MPSTSPPSAANAADGAHDRAEPGDDAGAQVVAVGEAARQDDRGDALERRLLVPQDDGLGAGELERVDRVAVAVAAREDDDPDPDRHRSALPRPALTADDVAPSGSIAYASMSGFDSSSEASRSTIARAAALVRRVDRQLDPPADADVADAVDARGGRGCPRPPGPAGSRMPGLGVTLTANRKLRHGAMTSSCR